MTATNTSLLPYHLRILIDVVRENTLAISTLQGFEGLALLLSSGFAVKKAARGHIHSGVQGLHVLLFHFVQHQIPAQVLAECAGEEND